MPDIVTKEASAEPNDAEKEEEENEDEPQLDKDKKHDSGAADLEKVIYYWWNFTNCNTAQARSKA